MIFTILVNFMTIIGANLVKNPLNKYKGKVRKTMIPGCTFYVPISLPLKLLRCMIAHYKAKQA